MNKKSILTLIAILIANNLFAQHESKEMEYFSHNEIFRKIDLLSKSQNTQIDSEVKIDSIVAYHFGTATERRFFHYNDQNKIESHIYQYFNNDIWEDSWKFTNEYDSFGNIISTLHAFNNNGTWQPDILESFSYDTNGNNIEHSHQFYQNNSWVNLFKNTNYFDSENKQTSAFNEEWSDTRWVNTSRDTLHYYENGLLESMEVEKWTDSSWQKNIFYQWEYNDDDKISDIIILTWDGITWKYLIKGTNKYEENIKEELIEIWEAGTWNNNARTTYTSDSKGYTTSGFYESFINELWREDSGVIIFQNPDNFFHRFWGPSEVLVYYNSTTSLNNEKNINLTDYNLSQNYPNPFNPNTKINYQIPSDGFVSLKIYDVTGQVVASLVNKVQTKGKYEIDFNATNLSSGIYFYRIKSGDFIKSMNMILLK